MKKGIALILLVFGFACCVKDRHCECKNSNGTYEAGSVKASRYSAKKKCKALSGGDTQCYLK